MGKASKIRANLAARKRKVTDISKLKDSVVYEVIHKGKLIKAKGSFFKEAELKYKAIGTQGSR